MGSANKAYEHLTAELREIGVLHSVANTLSWDQETMMPPKGSALRADQLQMLSGMIHERRTSKRFGELLAACENDAALTADDRVKANLREVRRDYDKATKLPKELVEELAKTASLGMEAWKEARKASDFPKFLPWLEKTVELNRRKAECYGVPPGGELYDALMDEYEPDMTSAETERIFKPLRAFTVDLVQKVAGAPKKPDVSPARAEFPVEKQKEFASRVIAQMGYDFNAGRMDDSAHPFCEGLGPGDCRITNRYRADGWCDSLSSATHEAGHAMYEQGLPKEAFFGQPLGQAVSLGIHESQSRMWENLVARSLPFWKWGAGVAKEVFGPGAGGFTPEALHRADNVVEPSFIRVESDEVTYNLHIMLRFDLERAMIKGDLKCRDLPGIWNERMKKDLGLTVKEDRVGCLQDVHWSMGAIGYFATYSFGNLYAAQFWEAMAKDIPDREARIERGDFAPILSWLREKVHKHGRQFTAPDLCKRITGAALSTDPLRRHLEGKVQLVYGV